MNVRLSGLLTILLSGIVYLIFRIVKEKYIPIPETIFFVFALITAAGIAYGLIKLIFGVE